MLQLGVFEDMERIRLFAKPCRIPPNFREDASLLPLKPTATTQFYEEPTLERSLHCSRNSPPVE